MYLADNAFTGMQAISNIDKCSSEICYPMDLDLAAYCTAECAASGTAFVLKFVWLHSGTTLHGGHYQCIQQDQNGVWWLRDDDEMPKQQSQLDTLTHHRDVCGLLYSKSRVR